MPEKERKSINTLLLEAHERGIELAIETSIRTGVPLVVEKEGKIFEIEPKYKYVRVPIKSAQKQI
jgi:hypothetical protein